MSQKKIKVGVIGTGFGAKVHVPIFSTHPNFEVVSIASVSRGNIEEIKKNTGIDRVYKDWKQMLDNEELDLVSIVSAPFLHHEMVIESYKRGLHVICEKPMAFDSNEAKEMIIARDRANKMGFINFEYRYVPARQKVKEIILSNTLGEIIHISYKCQLAGLDNLKDRRRGWLSQRKYGGGMLGALGSHMIDSLHWWTGKNFSEVTGDLTVHMKELIIDGEVVEERDAEDSFQILGQLSNEAKVTVDLLSAAKFVKENWRLEISGSQGSLIMTNDSKVEVAIDDSLFKEVELTPNLPLPEELSDVAKRYFQGFYPFIDNVFQSLQLGKYVDGLATFEDGYNVQCVIDSVRHADEGGKRVKVMY
ncbi:Gfo/Idh/MocA family oxidoreductase [Bacillus timonensis]|nr:Gfo/Idh/MocA family oxidoreductase [Bacillus timonensis]